MKGSSGNGLMFWMKQLGTFLKNCTFIAGHSKSKALSSKTKTRKKETGADIGKLADKITILRRTD